MPGPPPNPNARRRNARPENRRLPSSGRQGEPPAWPISRSSKGELSLWADLWASPQSVAWESLGWARTVARYCRFAVQAERRGASAFLLSEVRQLEDRLGLNPLAMKRLAWEIVDVAPQEETADDDPDTGVADLDRYRDRLG